MPFTPSPSSVFPNTRYTSTSETQEAFTWRQPERSDPHFYRGAAASTPAPYLVPLPATVESQLKELSQKVAALQAAQAAAAPSTDANAVAQAPEAEDGQVWEGATYTSFANYASEASRVRNAGRLPFPKDTMKIA